MNLRHQERERMVPLQVTLLVPVRESDAPGHAEARQFAMELLQCLELSLGGVEIESRCEPAGPEDFLLSSRWN